MHEISIKVFVKLARPGLYYAAFMRVQHESTAHTHTNTWHTIINFSVLVDTNDIHAPRVCNHSTAPKRANSCARGMYAHANTRGNATKHMRSRRALLNILMIDGETRVFGSFLCVSVHVWLVFSVHLNRAGK